MITIKSGNMKYEVLSITAFYPPNHDRTVGWIDGTAQHLYEGLRFNEPVSFKNMSIDRVHISTNKDTAKFANMLFVAIVNGVTVQSGTKAAKAYFQRVFEEYLTFENDLADSDFRKAWDYRYAAKLAIDCDWNIAELEKEITSNYDDTRDDIQTTNPYENGHYHNDHAYYFGAELKKEITPNTEGIFDQTYTDIKDAWEAKKRIVDTGTYDELSILVEQVQDSDGVWVWKLNHYL